MSRRGKGLLAVVFALVVFSSDVNSALADWTDADYGLRFGYRFDGGDEDLMLYEIYSGIPLPWGRSFSSGWDFYTMLDLSVGALSGGGDTGARIAAGIDLMLDSPGKKFIFTTGVGAGIMTEDEYGEEDFGGPVIFRYQAGINYMFTDNYGVGYKFFHESNGALYDRNPSLNMHMLELRLRF